MINKLIERLGGRERLEALIDDEDCRASVAEQEILAEIALTVMETHSDPVAWQFYDAGSWHNGSNHNNHRENTEMAGYRIRELYPIIPVLVPPEIVTVAKLMREWIDAIPEDVVASLPAMPGFDRDWADEVISSTKTEKPVVLQGGRLKPDGKFWYDEDTISNILYQAGIEVKK